MKPLHLPAVIVVKNNIRVIPKMIKETNIPALFKIAEANMTSTSTGVSPLDFPSEEHLLRMSRASMAALEYSLESSGRCVGFTVSFPSEMCRSCRPVSLRGFTVLHPDIHDIGLGQWGIKLVTPWAQDNGMPGLISRSSSTNKLGILHAQKAGLTFQVCVPQSYRDIEGRWHDDLIVTKFLPSDISKLTDSEVLTQAASSPMQFVYNKTPFRGNTMSQNVTLANIGECTIHTASEQELHNTYPMLFKAAQNGEGFGLDELPTYQIYRNHFMKERTLLLMDLKADHGRETIAAAVVGPSRICRSPDPPSCSLYMLVAAGWRKRGVGSAFCSLIFQYLQESGYSAVLTDVLVTDNLPYQFMTSLGFSNIGCVPKSAYVAGRGYSDAILFYKSFRKTGQTANL